MDMSKFNQLQRIREKMDKIYFGAGGKPGALKKAILTGKGNRNKMVQLNGLGSIIENVSDEDDLRTILGEDLFFEELNGFEGFDGLGEPASIATGAAITAASGVLGTIAALIKKLGNLFKKGSKSAEKFRIQDNGDNANERTRKFSFKNIFNKIKGKIQERRERKAMEEGGGGSRSMDEFDEGTGLTTMEPDPESEFILDPPMNTTRSPMNPDDYSDEDGEDSDNKEGWFKKNWKWAVPTAVGVVGGTILAVHLVKKNKKKKAGLAGVPKSKKSKKSKRSTSTRAKTTRKRTNKTSKRKTTSRKKSPKTRRKTNRSSIKKVELL